MTDWTTVQLVLLNNVRKYRNKSKINKFYKKKEKKLVNLFSYTLRPQTTPHLQLFSPYHVTIDKRNELDVSNSQKKHLLM